MTGTSGYVASQSKVKIWKEFFPYMKIFSRTAISLLALSLLLFGAAAFAAETAAAGDPAAKAPAPVNFGKDANKMQWYLVNYGKEGDGHFAVARKYYTNPDEKEKTVDLIVTKFAIEQEKASGLYFTEYRYEYSADGKQFALAYINHYDMLGNMIKSTEYQGPDRVFYTMTKDMIPYKAYAYASGKLPAQKKTPAKKK